MPHFSRGVRPCWAGRVAESLAGTALLVVAVLLVLGVWRQLVLLGPRGQLFDSLGIVPQWKFFALSAVAAGDDIWDDHHLLIRRIDPGGVVSPWEDIFWNPERTWIEALWNPQRRQRAEIQHQLALAAVSSVAGTDQRFQSSLTYLTVLRFCIDRVRPTSEQALQFAVVASRGRGARLLAVRFVSAWHTP